MCGETLGRPIAFLGSPEEEGRNAFHLPPMHVSCAQAARADDQVLVSTSGFEFVRPNREDTDRRPRFEPNSLLVTGRVPDARPVAVLRQYDPASLARAQDSRSRGRRR